ncbi:40S ribosomal protein SA, partial [Trifolium medium]|nr:40S ribosomal protein SA [Trifolium medium]
VPQPIAAAPGVNWAAPEAGDWGEAVPPPQQIPPPGVESIQATGWE